MVAIGDGAKKIIAEDIEKLGGSNQFTLWTRRSTFKRGRPRRTTERYTIEDASAIEAKCPEVLYVLPNHENYEILVTSRDGGQTRALLEASTEDYALGMGWELQAGRFLTENDIETAAQVCVLGADAATDLFGEVSAVGQEISVGAKRIDIFLQFLTESICLCLCGAVLGIVGGWGAAQAMSRLAVRIVLVVETWPVVFLRFRRLRTGT